MRPILEKEREREREEDVLSQGFPLGKSNQTYSLLHRTVNPILSATVLL